MRDQDEITKYSYILNIENFQIFTNIYKYG